VWLGDGVLTMGSEGLGFNQLGCGIFQKFSLCLPDSNRVRLTFFRAGKGKYGEKDEWCPSSVTPLLVQATPHLSYAVITPHLSYAAAGTSHTPPQLRRCRYKPGPPQPLAMATDNLYLTVWYRHPLR